MREGILVGADKRIEELIPWWWGHYSRYNDRPAAVVDFGMSKEGIAWCRKHMTVIPLPKGDSYIQSKREVSAEQAKKWKKRYPGPLWKVREAWFKKPSACLLSPFDLTLWIDLDCEICGPLNSLFEEWEEGVELAIVREDFRLSWQLMYNSGVILFRKGSPFLKRWGRLCQKQNGSMMGDQDVLTQMLVEGKVPFKELSPFYNWLMYGGMHPGIVIAHWAGGWGKEYIRRFGGLHALSSKEAVRKLL